MFRVLCTRDDDGVGVRDTVTVSVWRSSRWVVVGWWLLGAGLLVVCATFLVRAYGASSDAEFGRAVGWANILGFVVGGLGVSLVAFDKFNAARQGPSLQVLRDAADRLAQLVLVSEGEQRAKLLGTDRPNTQAINIGFYRDMVRFRAAGGDERGQLDTVLDYYQSLNPGRFVILGEPGSGKTVLALHLLVQILEERQAERAQPDGSTWPVPVRFSLATFDTSLALTRWMSRQLEERFGLSGTLAEELTDKRRILPILDGLDEMDPDQVPPRRAAAAVDQINAYVYGSKPSPVIVTCRRHRYEQLAQTSETPDLATDVYIEELDAEQVRAYLVAQVRSPADKEAWRAVLSSLDENPKAARALIRALSSPWRLTLALTAYRDGADPKHLLAAASVAPTEGDPSETDPVMPLLLSKSSGKHPVTPSPALQGSSRNHAVVEHPRRFPERANRARRLRTTSWCTTCGESAPATASALVRPLSAWPHRCSASLA